jgi:hypothetical protein
MSSIDSGEPQCAQAVPRARSTGPPQFEQLTVCTFLRSSAICCGVSGRMKSFSFRIYRTSMPGNAAPIDDDGFLLVTFKLHRGHFSAIKTGEFDEVR